MSAEFPKRFCQALRKAYYRGELQFGGDAKLTHLQSSAEFEQWLEPLENMSWVVHAATTGIVARPTSVETPRKRSFGTSPTTWAALHSRTAGSWTSTDDRVLFRYKDYRDDNQQKDQWIEGVELIHRFLQHLLPPRFRHIRYYGWMGPRVKPEKRDFIRSYHGLDDV